MQINMFKNAWGVIPEAERNIKDFVLAHKNGEWEKYQSTIEDIRKLANEKNVIAIEISKLHDEEDKEVKEIKEAEHKALQDKYSSLKNTLPTASISGIFDTRSKKGLLEHSGFLCVDIDTKPSENPHLMDESALSTLKSNLTKELFVYAIIRSVGGKGFAVIVKTSTAAGLHEKYFHDIERVFKEKYSITVDTNCKDVCRVRFISYDPEVYLNENALAYYLDDNRKELKEDSVDAGLVKESLTTAQDGFESIEREKVEEIVRQLEERKIVLGDDSYANWRDIGFALAHEFGEEGREFFHRVSRPSPKYDKGKADNQYDKCLTGNGEGKKIRIATFYHYAKEAGCHVEHVTKSQGEFPLTECGNAERFVSDNKGAIRYCHEANKWFVWSEDKGYWEPDGQGIMMALAKKTARDISLDAEAVSDKKLKAIMVAHGKRSEALHGVRSMITLSESEPGIPITPTDMDKNPWLFNCANGTIDLKTGKLKDARKEDLLSKRSPVNYNPDAKCPQFLKYLRTIMDGNEKMVSFLQRALGYTLTGSVREDVFFLLTGNGSNGKTSLINIVGHIMGDYETATSFLTFQEKNKGAISNDIAALHGARFVHAEEPTKGIPLDESMIKSVTGGGKRTARFLHKEFFTFKPIFKAWLLANDKPEIKGKDWGIWRRIMVIVFPIKFYDPTEKDVVIKEKDIEIDKTLRDALLKEAEGVLVWMVEGSLEWQEKGLLPPEPVQMATEEYKKELDVVGSFLEERCNRIEGTNGISKQRLFTAFTDYCKDTRDKNNLTMIMFGKELRKKGIEEDRKSKLRTRSWIGVGLKSDSIKV